MEEKPLSEKKQNDGKTIDIKLDNLDDRATNRENTEPTSNENNKSKFNFKKFFNSYKWYILGALLLIIIIVVIIVIFALKKSEKKPKENPTQPVVPIVPIPGRKLKNEFQINTKIGDLKLISVVQKYIEETIMNNEKIVTEVLRKTKYHFYIKNEELADEDNELFYDKMFTGVISIKSECITSDGSDCEQKTLIDLTNKSNTNRRNIRVLEDLNDIPIALCTFKITNNDFITSITCPESFPEVKKNEIILDLYFLRPPAIQRPDKQKDNITLTINEDEYKRKHIHETNGGKCNIYNNWGSICTTEMNTTLDSDNNLISYNEIAYTKINYDENNSYMKNKVTNLIDESENIKQIDIENYEKSLNILLNKLEPYMKEDTQFTHSEFVDLYNIIQERQNKSYNYIPKKKSNVFRNLANPKDKYIKRAHLFSQEALGIQFNLDLKIDSGLNSKMGAFGSLFFDSYEHNFTSIEQYSTITELIDELSGLSKSGNVLAEQLSIKIKEKLENIINVISIKINTLEELLMYYDLCKVFNSTLIKYSYKKLPAEIVQVSNDLISRLNGFYIGIRQGRGEINIQVKALTDIVYNFLDDLHELIRKMLNHLGDLTNTLITKNNTFTVITNYYSNNTSASYYNIIQTMRYILDNYYKDEYEMIFPKIQELLILFRENADDYLRKELISFIDFYNNILNKTYIINDI